MRKVLTLGLICFSLSSLAQKLVKFQDEELELSVEIPRNWNYVDDSYNFFIIPSTNNDEFISITYIESDRTDLNEYIQFRLQYFYPNNVRAYKQLDIGDDEVGSYKAKWIKFESKENNQEYIHLVYHFIDYGQLFIASAKSLKINEEKYKDKYLQVIKSIKVKMN